MKTTALLLLAVLTLNAAATAQNTPASPSAPPTMGRENKNPGTNRSNTITTDPSRTDRTGTMDKGTMEKGTMDKDIMRNDGSTTTMERGDARTMIGNMSRADFDRRNAEGNTRVAAITPTSAPLSKSDQKLLVQMALGGSMQLRASQSVVGRVQRDDVRVLAQSEVEEQTGVSAKIQEIARAKGMTLGNDSGAATTNMLVRMQDKSGADLDRYYTQSSGVNGHEKLMKMGEKIMANAKDPALRALAEATAPVIKMHMQISQQVLDKMGNDSSGSR